MVEVSEKQEQETNIESSRECTRCQGKQYLVGSGLNFGKYTCIECEMIVGFDLDAEEGQREFLINRGICYKYDKELPNTMLGVRLGAQEMRL